MYTAGVVLSPFSILHHEDGPPETSEEMLAPPGREPAPLASSDFHHRSSKRNGFCLGSTSSTARGRDQQSRPLHLLCDEWDDQRLPVPTTHDSSVTATPSTLQHSWKPIARLWRLDVSSDSSPSLSALKMENVHGVDVSWLHNPKTPRGMRA